MFIVFLEISTPNFNLVSKTVVISHQSHRRKTGERIYARGQSLTVAGKHQNVLNLDCEKIDRKNKTLQEVKCKSIEDQAKRTDAQKLNAKTEIDAVKVLCSNI